MRSSEATESYSQVLTQLNKALEAATAHEDSLAEQLASVQVQTPAQGLQTVEYFSHQAFPREKAMSLRNLNFTLEGFLPRLSSSSLSRERGTGPCPHPPCAGGGEKQG